jgi:selenocysteine lyase/cysteine desulfurase
MINLKKEFPAAEEYTYLNTASCGLLSQSLVEWRHQHDNDLCKGGSVFRDLHKSHIESIRKTVSSFFKTPVNTVALIPNFSFGFNILLDGLPRNIKILMLETDYPSINWAVENRDFDVCYAKIDEYLEENINKAVAEHQPDVFVFSIVQYLTGIKIDFNFLKQLKAYHPNLLIIADGTQFLGTTEFNFSDSAIDILGASTYKWLLAGYGNAILMAKEEVQNKIFPKTIGFNSADAVFSKREEVSFIKRFEPGHQDTLNYGSLEQSIYFLNNYGMDVISERINILSNKAKSEFTALGLLENEVVNRGEHSNIFNIKADNKLFKKLKDNNIICSQRGKGIRVSFHFYNTDSDLEKLLSVIKS